MSLQGKATMSDDFELGKDEMETILSKLSGNFHLKVN